MFQEAFAQDADTAEASVMAAMQKPISQSVLGEKSGPPAWKQLPTWYQISEGDHIIPPDAQHNFAKQMNATTLSINSSHASLVSHSDEIVQLILNATKGNSAQTSSKS
jgi:pimeloyl-ACP methyl ester carboxylesterase